MKDKIIGLLLIVIVLLLFVIVNQNRYNRYDLNRDGQVDLTDLLELQRYYIKHHNPYDVNCDGQINAQDYVTVKNYIMERSDNNG